jgi:uncharacterized membrane protein required for colicin V production
MIPIYTVFICFLFLFAVIGGLRGWAKEIIVVFSVILALFIEHILLTFLPPVKTLFTSMAPQSQFYTRAVLFLVITVFGYASPTIAARFGAKVARERLQDLLLGFFIGLINGFLIVGTLLSFLNAAHYGVAQDRWTTQPRVVIDPATGQPVPALDRNGQPVVDVVYLPGAKGVGGITPPELDSTSRNLIAFLPPELVARSNVALYIAVAAAFVFVLIVFI